MSYMVSCPMDVKNAKVVGGCQGKYPALNSSSSSVQSTSAQLLFIGDNTDFDFLLITSYPNPMMFDHAYSGTGYAASAIGNINPIPQVAFKGKSNTIYYYFEYNDKTQINAMTCTIDTNNKITMSATLSRHPYSGIYTAIAYKYED